MGAEKGLGRSPCRRRALLQEEGSNAVGLGPSAQTIVPAHSCREE